MPDTPRPDLRFPLDTSATDTECPATVGVVAYWNDDGESWWFDTGDADDADAGHRFHAQVPAAMWEASSAAYKAWTATLADLQEAMGLSHEGTLEQVCGEWTGTVREPEPFVTLEVPVGGNGHHMYFGGHDTEADAAALLASLPEVVYVLAWGKPTEIRRDTIVVKAGEHRGYESECRRCGWGRAEHTTEPAEEATP